jgi:hypothetical protein
MEVPDALAERRYDCGSCGAAASFLAVRCDRCEDRLFWWDHVVETVVDHPELDVVSLPKYRVNHPLWEGFERGWGWPKLGLYANYRKQAPDGRGVHVREFEREYELHIDSAHPEDQWLKHLVVDAPRILEGRLRTGPTVPRLRDDGDDGPAWSTDRLPSEADDWRRYGASLKDAAGRIRDVYGRRADD